MPYRKYDIENNLPVLPVHILQIIDSLQFGSASIDNARAGRTNFGAASFTSSAHTEFHDYNGGDPIAVYAGSTKVLTVTTAGDIQITGSLSVTGTLEGTAATASYVENAQTASYVQNAVSSSFASTASFVQLAQTASFVQNAQTASYVLNAVSSSFASTASFVQNAQTASFVQNAQTASFVQLAQTASFVQNAQTASFVQLAQTASFVQNAQTASYVLNAVSSSFASTASFVQLAQTASFVQLAQTASYLNTLNQTIGITGSVNLTGSLTLNGVQTLTRTVNISSAQLLTAVTSPVQLIPPPGSGKVTVVRSITAIYDYGTTPYATNTDVRIEQDGALLFSAPFLLSYTYDYLIYSSNIQGGGFPFSLDNATVNLTVNTGNPTTGNGTMKVIITYDVINL